ncbi:MAG TPA: FAD-binding protein [Anaerohalosphaeraceae bacterium]|nr:FAD-binding protein [Phycisphaerae bacterium]HOL32225.1 FAD-binding protein [Anaerohalosphaeraceae bacterium]HOM76613.1 FAD-binding protein [Anaerohalosphaeraceae bacterium]HPC63581.1 FAD-binding protein [Anaerohalosphaeraceae bacterium]HPO69761.1 FAD-binding protein [Anaerohalosphaeraceae bacterium]
MKKKCIISGQTVRHYFFNTVIVGTGAAGLNCAKRLYELMDQKGFPEPHQRIALVTAGIGLGASRMSGSDKQTYYKTGTSPYVPDCAERFAQALTAGGCCHGDLALAEAVGSLGSFYALAEAGVPFPTNAMGSFIGYKTDNDPSERAASAGPETSRFMCECLERIVRRYGIAIYENQEAADLLTVGTGTDKRIVGLAAVSKTNTAPAEWELSVFYCENLVLAAGGPGGLYQTSVYPPGQIGLHGIALRAGLAAENLTESQFGLASIRFRWNVSGTYMQAIPRFFSTDANGGGEKDFLADFFPTKEAMASAIFLKGYQWPFDAQRVEAHQSSLIDLLVLGQMHNGRRVFLDFRRNPMDPFRPDKLESEALAYLTAAGALQQLPIERLEKMNPPAVEIFRRHGIDLASVPLEVAVCAQHNNGGFAVNHWWESNIPHTFVIGEMAGTHGIRRPGGAALNAGQVGAARAAEYIVNCYGSGLPDPDAVSAQSRRQIQHLIEKYSRWKTGRLATGETIEQIQQRMSTYAGPLRKLSEVRRAFCQALDLYQTIRTAGFRIQTAADLIAAIRAEHLSLASAAYLKAIEELLSCGGGSRGSYLVLSDEGIEIDPAVQDPYTLKPLRFLPENKALRSTILRIAADENSDHLFACEHIPPRPMPKEIHSFEAAWADYRNGRIYK